MQAGILGALPPTTITLNTTTLPDIQAGSVVLIIIAVGKIIAILNRPRLGLRSM